MANLIVFPHELLDPQKKQIWQSIQNYHNGIYTKIYARKCDIRLVDPIAAKNFLENNHLQGNYFASVNLGLYQQEELVALMTFSKPRFNRDYQWELIRYCNKIHHQVLGGASKLLAHFIKQYQPKTIISYADKRHSDGKLYQVLGFTHTHNSGSNYWYIKDDIVLSRIACQKHKLERILGPNFDKNKTEKENMRDAGFQIVRDVGNMVFELIIIDNMSYNEIYYFNHRQKLKEKSKKRHNTLKNVEDYKKKRKDAVIKFKTKPKIKPNYNPANPTIEDFEQYTDHCVYLILNKLNSKKYIGITHYPILTRFHQHSISHTPIGKAIRKYGPGNFHITLLHSNLNEIAAKQKEMQEIENHQTYVSGYNQSPGGEGLLGGGMDVSIKEKLSKANIIRKYVLQHQTGEIVSITSLRKFCKERNLYAPNFSKLMRGQRTHVGGWKILSMETTDKQKETRFTQNHQTTSETKNKIREKKTLYKWRIVTPEKKELIVESLEEYCKIHNLNATNMRSVADGLYSSSKGYKVWRLDKHTLEVLGAGPKEEAAINNQYWAQNLQTNERYEFHSLREFCLNHKLGYKYMFQFIAKTPRQLPYRNWLAGRL